ncbi:MAG TPA: hypothetical protein VGX95_15160 [Xanthobacteraceae bacterium]|nr:hypothetical protein [Xanthobacteraceae bacterium]
MKTKLVVIALAALPLIPIAGVSQAAVHRSPAVLQGHQGEAPPWSFACMKDHGPTQCGEPMWIYGN